MLGEIQSQMLIFLKFDDIQHLQLLYSINVNFQYVKREETNFGSISFSREIYFVINLKLSTPFVQKLINFQVQKLNIDDSQRKHILSKDSFFQSNFF